MTDPGLQHPHKTIATLLLLAGLALAPMAARADDASAKLFQMKCIACHAADGTGNTPVGKTLKIKDLADPDVQKDTDAAMTDIITMGKDKMPAYGKALKPDQIKGLVAYVRSLAHK
jgi:cytochrome c6